MVWVIIGLLYVLTFVGAKNNLPPHVESFLLLLLALTLGVHVANRWLVPHSNPVLLPLATLLLLLVCCVAAGAAGATPKSDFNPSRPVRMSIYIAPYLVYRPCLLITVVI